MRKSQDRFNKKGNTNEIRLKLNCKLGVNKVEDKRIMLQKLTLVKWISN